LLPAAFGAGRLDEDRVPSGHGHGRVEPGAVFRWSHDDSLMRVLMCDDSVVMYDAWCPHLGNWGLADLRQARRKRVHYYVATLGTVLKKAAYVRMEPLSGDEVTMHRPDR
jgi:hypothetical protein